MKTTADARRRLLARMPVTERRLDLAGISTPVLEGGDGEPLVLLHGPGEHATKWLRIVPDLVETHRVIAPDLPGHGESEVVRGELDAEQVIAWLGELIDRTCEAKPTIVAQTLGGPIAARFAARHGNRIEQLVLVDALGLAPFEPAPEFGRALEGFYAQPTAETHDELWSRCAYDLDRLRDGMGEDWDALAAYNLDRARTPRMIEAVGKLMAEFGFPPVDPAELERIAVPTTLIWGREDLATALEKAEAASAAHGWPLRVIEGAADDPPIERPDAFLEVLRGEVLAPASRPATDNDVIVVGAGPAGIAAAVALKDRGVRPVVLEQADQVAASWRRRYDRLRLNTWRAFSHLPDRPYPKGTPTFPTRDQVIAHVEEHAHEDGIDLRLGTRVERIAANRGGWTVHTDAGEMHAAQVVIATGHQHQPLIPDWPGRDSFGGRLLHAADYRNPEPFAGREVLVVGAGCSGMEIAHDLAEGGAAKVWMAVRTPPNIVLRQGPGPVPGDLIAVTLWHAPVPVADAVARFGRRMDFGDLSEYGLPVPEEGTFTRAKRLGVAPSIVDEDVIEAIRERRIEVVAAVESLDPSGVRLADGSRLEPAALVCATGYRRALEPLVGHLGVLDERGAPRALGPTPPADGLRFIGFVPRPGGIGYMAKEAKRAARSITRELRSAGRT